MVRSFASSLFVRKMDRINVVFYGQQTEMYSLGVRDAGDYVVLFYPDLKVRVPGGYGWYRVGALGKLIQLEDRPEILTTSLSGDLATFVQYYYYTPSDTVYYGTDYKDEVRIRPSILDLLIQKTNAPFFDRVYLFLLLSNKRGNDFQIISFLKYKERHGDRMFSSPDFMRSFQGVFYQSTYRKENRNIQILYGGSYRTAHYIGEMLNGTGIRVSDISLDEEQSREEQQCRIIESVGDREPYSATARQIASFFSCVLERGETDIYDILFVLSDVEERWEVKK